MGRKHSHPVGELRLPPSGYTENAPGAAGVGSDPRWQKELDVLAANDNPVERSEAFERLAAMMSDDECVEALTKLMHVELDDGLAEFRSLLVRRWAEQKPAEAAAWIAQWPDNAVTREANSQVAIVWANVDLHGALAWVQSLPEGETKTAAQVNLGYEAARSDVSAALAIAAQLSEGTQRDRLLGHAVRQWAATEPSEAAEWVSQIQDSVTRQRLLGDIAIDWAERDPAAAASAAVNALPPGESLDRRVVGIVQRWAQRAPEEAANWITDFPAMPLRDVAAHNLVIQWAHNDLALPAGWLANLPAGSLRDSAVASYAIALGPRDPGTASEWIKTITDASQRAGSFEALSRLWPDM